MPDKYCIENDRAAQMELAEIEALRPVNELRKVRANLAKCIAEKTVLQEKLRIMQSHPEAPNVWLLGRVWNEGDGIQFELHDWKIFVNELQLELSPNKRPITDWYEEGVQENTSTWPECFLPPCLEICTEAIWVELIGHYSADAWQDYFGEWDEDFSFTIMQWTVALDDEDPHEQTEISEDILEVVCG